MINIRTLRKVQNNGGLTLKKGKIINYKSGWQVADFGYETTDINEAMQTIRKMGGNCGVWLENGVYYIDHSFRVSTKKEALAIGREHNQISILNWKTMDLAYCSTHIFQSSTEHLFDYRIRAKRPQTLSL